MLKSGEFLFRLLVDHPKKCFFISLLAFLGLAPGMGLLQEEYDVRQWLSKSEPVIAKLEKFEARFGSEDTLLFAVSGSGEGGIFNLETATTLNHMVEDVWQLPMVVKVEGLTNYNHIGAEGDEIVIAPFLEKKDFPKGSRASKEYFAKKRGQALAHRVLPGHLISRDGKATLIFARLEPAISKKSDSGERHNLSQKANELAEKYRGLGLEVHVGGGPWMVATTTEKIVRRESQLVLPGFLAIIFLYLLFLLRSPIAATLPLLLTLVTVATMFGIGCFFGVKFYSIFELLPGVMITLAVADSLHILVYYYQRRGLGEGNREALLASLRKNYLPSVLTTVSTMLALLSLTLSEVIPIRLFGILGSLGCLLAWLFTIFMICPAILWINPKVPRHFQRGQGDGEAGVGSLVEKLASFLNRRRVAVAVFFLGITIPLTVFTFKNQINANPYLDFQKSVPIRITHEFLMKHFGSTGPEIVIDSGKVDGIKDPAFLSKVEAFKDWLDRQAWMGKTVDIVSIVKEMNQNFHGGREEFYKIPTERQAVAELLFLYTVSLPAGTDINNLMATNYDSLRIATFWKFETSTDWSKHTDLILQKAEEFDLKASITGQIDLAHRLAEKFVSAFTNSIVMVPIFVTILLLFAFRSLPMGILSVFANVFPMVVGGGIMYLSNMALSAGTVLVAAVCMGVTVDDTIHFILGYYRARRVDALGVGESVGKTFRYTVSSLLTTTLILVGGFALYIPSDLVLISKFGILCCSILSAALLGDVLLLPALLFIFERKKGAS